MNKITAAVLAISTLAGCATRPTSEEAAAPVPASRIYQAGITAPANPGADGTIVFLRDWGFIGAGCDHDVWVDNVKSFSIGHREQIAIRLPAGDHLIRLENASVLCPSVAASQEAHVVAGSRTVYRIQLPAAGGVSFSRIQ